MTEQPARGMTMASRGQAAHHPDPKPTPHLSMTERIRVAEFDAAPEPPELVVERVARAMHEELQPADDPWNVAWDDKGELAKNRYRRMATAAITAMEETR